MFWKGKELKTIEDLMLRGIDQCNNKEEAQQFILQYVEENIHARENIGYLAGYYDRDDQARIFDWFDVCHPIYGRNPLPTKIMMEMGMRMGERMRNPEKFKTDDLNVADFIRANIDIAAKEGKLPNFRWHT
jgi:hypothetical protein